LICLVSAAGMAHRISLTWLTGVIGVYDMVGVGKTFSLLQVICNLLIYNTYKEELSVFFDVVVWFAV